MAWCCLSILNKISNQRFNDVLPMEREIKMHPYLGVYNMPTNDTLLYF
jgi:hypothetical protein